MMVMTAKVDLKKAIFILGGIVLVILALIGLLGSGSEAASAPGLSSNDGRVKFLTDLGWDVAASPVESSQVKIPSKTTEVFDRYNALQKSQGYDLSQYAGKNAMRYVYKVNNYPGATEPVYATLLIYKNQVIGGDITDTAPGGRIRTLRMSQAQESTVPPTDPSAAPETT